MARKQVKLSRRMLFIWLTLAGSILLFAPKGITSKAHLAFAQVFSWPLSVGRNIPLWSAAPKGAPDEISSREHLQQKNHIINLTEQRDQLLQQIEVLQMLRRSPEWKRTPFVLAAVITAPQGIENEVFVNRGTEDGVRKGHFVLGDNSVVGRVVEVMARTARVRLVTAPNSTTAVRVHGSESGRLMVGNGDGTSKIQLVKEKVPVGTQIVACARPGYLDCAMVTGVVSRCERNAKNPLVYDVIVKPACDITKVRGVAVIASSGIK